MYAQGATTRQIAEAVGISQAMVSKDIATLRDTWCDDLSDRLESARAELAVKHDYIYREAVGEYRRGGGIKALELASKELECLARLFGVANGVSVNLHAHQHLHQISPDQVADLFKPLDAGSYAEMVATRALPEADSAEPLSKIEEALSTELAETQSQNEQFETTALQSDWPIAIDTQSCVSAMNADDQASAPASPQMIKHPRQ